MATLVQTALNQYVTKTNLAAAVAAADSANKTIVVTGAETISTSLTIPATRTLRVEKGATITVASGQTLTIGGLFSAGPYQVFSGAGTVSGLKEVRPEWFGTDNTALQKALAVNGNNPCTVILQDGKTYDITGGVAVTAQNKTLKGRGILSGGSITIGAASGSAVDMDFVIDGPTFSYASLASSQPGIVLQRARIGKIRNCRFVNTDKSIEIVSVDAIQHVNTLQINNNEFDNVNHCVYSSGIGATNKLTVGDIEFSHNHICYARISHLYLTGQDGFIINSNYFFFPGYALSDTTKQYNIYMDYVVNGVISDNQMFEAGVDGIRINDARRTTIADNQIVWPGQHTPGCGINLTNTTLYGVEQNGNIIHDNEIHTATLHGISVSEQNKCNLRGNSIEGTGVNTYYYGTSPTPANLWSSATHYTINAGGAVNGHYNTRTIMTDNNLADTSGALPNYPSTILTYLNYFRGNLTNTGATRTSKRYATYSGTETSLAAAGYDILALNQSGATTVVAVTGGEDGQVIQVEAYNGNTTLDDNATGETVNRLVLKAGANVTLTAGNIVTLQYMNDKWKEIARNF